MRSINHSRLLLLAAGLLCAAPAIAKTPVSAMPLANPGSWINSSDYPAYALRQNLEGISRFRLTIDGDGRVTACLITVSSGSEVLDEATCRVLTQRARFSPALDRKGRPVNGHYENSVRWQIPNGQSIPQPGQMVSSILVSPEGAPLLCKIEALGGHEASRKEVGPMPCPMRALDHPYTDALGNPVAKRIRFTQKIELLDVTPAELEAARQAAANASTAPDQKSLPVEAKKPDNWKKKD